MNLLGLGRFPTDLRYNREKQVTKLGSQLKSIKSKILSWEAHTCKLLVSSN